MFFHGFSIVQTGKCSQIYNFAFFIQFLYSFWGKFVEALSHKTSRLITSPLELARIQNDRSKHIVDVHYINQDIMGADIETKDDYVGKPNFQSEIIGVFVTSYSRLILYETMEKIKAENLLYTDTDSYLFIESADGQPEIKTGPYLGCLEDELPPNVHITRYCASAPKSYAYLRSDLKEVIKLKGIGLHSSNAEIFDFDCIRNVVLGKLKCVSTVEEDQFARIKYRGLIYKRPHIKKFRMTFSKRKLVKGKPYSVPFGYRGRLW